MVLLTSLFTFAVSALLLVPGIASTAINTTRHDNLGNEAREILSRATPAPPHWVIYWDKFISGESGPPAVSDIKGFNVFALSFLLVEGAFDQAEEWTTLTATQRTTIKSQYAAAGIKLIVSVFGATDAPTSTGADPVATANTFAAFVKQFDLDGVDVDYELPTSQFEEGTSEYTTCSGLLTTSSDTWPQSALFQIARNGVPLSKLVIGKPATKSDASNGFMPTTTLASCLETAKAQGWSEYSSSDTPISANL
ncbi:hypothetical protein C0993_007167 [Termitomyces sp. T159_Od127]|nr:hypothetical protein C0993_007167 [Termitomyces sp. T159_Od127]